MVHIWTSHHYHVIGGGGGGGVVEMPHHVSVGWGGGGEIHHVCWGGGRGTVPVSWCFASSFTLCSRVLNLPACALSFF